MRAFHISLLSSAIINGIILFSILFSMSGGMGGGTNGRSSLVFAQESSRANETVERATLEDTPQWLHTYPGSNPQITLANKTGGTTYVSFQFTTGDSVDSVISYYKREMQVASLPASDEVTQGYDGVAGRISTNASIDPRIKILAQSSRGAKTKVEVTFSSDINAVATRNNVPTPIPDTSDVRWRDEHKLLSIKEFTIDIALITGIVAALFVWISQLVQCTMIEENAGTKRFWIIIMLVTNFIGAVVYFFVRRPQRIEEVGR
ncbi:MAG: PLD nuclease N-terminal domain-containing protein [Pyrinomonadaceae bacterium]